MPKQIMYAGMNNSPQTVLTAAITASAQVIPVAGISALPAAPNITTLGTGDGAEVVFYNGIDGSTLTGCIRGFGGTTAKIWPSDTVVYRAFTLRDYQTLCENIDALFDEKIKVDGDASTLTSAFSIATARANIVTGETLAVLLGKLAKWYSDLKTVAWSGRYSDLTGVPASFPPTAHASAHALGGSDAVSPAAIGAAAVSHAHAIGNVTGLQSALDGKQPKGNYLTAETDPTVPAWAKAPNKPTYTAAEVGAALPSKELTASLPASGWTGTAAPYTQTVSVAGMTLTTNALLDYEHSADAATEAARSKAWACISYCDQGVGSIVVRCLDKKPEVALTMKIIVLG